MEYKELLEEVRKTSEKIKTLEKERNRLIHDNMDSFVQKCLGIMDWSKVRILTKSVDYDELDKSIKVELTVVTDPNARYVFKIDRSTCVLLFRQIIY